ncbi:hypothetical protein ACQ4PT_067354 [Festuca glaucescens]
MPPLYILLGLLLFSSLHTPSCFSATANDTLTAGQALAVGDKLVSRNGKFALGFFQPAASITSKSDNTISPNSNWYLGIWFNKIPVFTTVWVANRDEPITDSKLNLTQLKISSNGNLAIITHAGTESLIWSTHIANRTQTSINANSAVLLNSGNLALFVESPSSKVPLWQSFDYPADVALSGSKFGRNKVTGLNRQLISKKSLIDPGLGSYSMGLGTGGMVLQRSNPSIVYWSWASGTSTSKLIPILEAILETDPRTNGLFNLTYVDNNVEEYYMYTLPDDTYSVFISLDISGQIKLNIWSETKQSWKNLHTQPVDPCSPPATCGPFTVCNNKASPSCSCMESFSQKSPHDWEFDDRTGGCIRDTPLHCTGKGNTTSSTDVFHPIAKVQLPISRKSIDVATSQSKCEEACLNSCICTAYSYNNSRCSVWHGELFSVNLNDGIGITSEDALYLRLAAKDLPNLRRNRRKPNNGFVTAASAISLGIIIMLMLLIVIWRNKFKCCGSPSYDNQGSGGVIAFRYADLVHATKNFSEKLGAGGFGSVYKGVLSDSTTIAVKRLDGARQGEKQFRAEVSSIGLIQHINLVKLIGFCCEAFVVRDFSRVLTTFRGTAGYLAPEWLSGVAITPKIDVYSFGLVLLEIISGRRNSRESYSSSNYHMEYFPVLAITKLHEGDVLSLVDPQLHGDLNLEQAERACKVACWCIQDNEFDRPTMLEVVRVLEGPQDIDMPPMPRLLAAITERSDATSM